MASSSKFDLPYDYKTVTLHGQTVTVRVYHRSYKGRRKAKITSTAKRMKAPAMTAGQMKREGFIK